MDEWSFAKTLSQCCSLFSRVGRSKESSDLCKKGTGRHIMLLSKDLKKTYAHLIYLYNGWLNGLRQSIPLRVWKIIELLLVMSYCCLFHDWGLFVAFSVTEERLFIRRIVLSFLSKVEVAFPWADCSFRSSQQLMLLKYILKLSLIVRYMAST